MRRIYLAGKKGKGKYTVVDDDAYERIMEVDSNVSIPNYHPIFHHDGKVKLLHRFIVGEENIPKGKHIDHINDNTLDNRRENLRICTRSENMKNRKRSRHSDKDAKSHSEFKGVSKTKSGKFLSNLTCTDENGEYYRNSKLFDNELDAALYYNDMAREKHGSFGRINTVPVPGDIGIKEADQKYGKYIGDDNNAR